jgi:hypothetical protein
MKQLIDLFFEKKNSKHSKILKHFKIGWKTKILVIFSCDDVHFLRFFFEHLKSHKKRRGEIFFSTRFKLFFNEFF